MSVLSFISGLFESATKLVDKLHTSEEVKLDMRWRIQSIENEFMSKVLDYETKLMDSQPPSSRPRPPASPGCSATGGRSLC